MTIPANAASGEGTLTLTLIDDDLTEGDETIIVGGSFTGFTIASDTITIHDDEAAYLSIAGPGTVNEGEDAEFTVALSKAVPAEVTVEWTHAPGTASTSDYTAAPSTVTFAANSTDAQTITIAVTDDDLSETAETFTVALGADTGDEADAVFVKTTEARARPLSRRAIPSRSSSPARRTTWTREILPPSRYPLPAARSPGT